MHKLMLNKVGPIDHCEVNISDFVVLTGAQASGKSTIAKAIFFFRTVKDDILNEIAQGSVRLQNTTLSKAVTLQLRSKFLQLFGTSYAMSKEMEMVYNYDSSTYVRVTLSTKVTDAYISTNYVYFTYSSNIKDFLTEHTQQDIACDEDRTTLIQELNDLFSDDSETIFIPAGRNLITLLTSQLNYIFTGMNEIQKRSIDLCTQKYIERILRIRSHFNRGIEGFIELQHFTNPNGFNYQLAKQMNKLVERVLKGRYTYSGGEECLYFDDDHYVKINYTSSGQQEAVWIFNILMYQIISKIKTFVIVEEPEAHLYPNAQKDICDFLALFLNAGNAFLLTTHSPYILGSFNNLLYAHNSINELNKNAISAIVPLNMQLRTCAAYYVNDGIIEDCFDTEFGIIDNGVIDGASDLINNTFDRLIEAKREEK